MGGGGGGGAECRAFNHLYEIEKADFGVENIYIYIYIYIRM